MNTVHGSRQSDVENSAASSGGFDLPARTEAQEVEKLTAALAQLETNLVSERDAWREKEFIYIAVMALLGTVIFFKFLEGDIVAMLLISLFELVILFGLAKRLGVDWAEKWYGWLAHVIAQRFSGSDGGKE